MVLLVLDQGGSKADVYSVLEQSQVGICPNLTMLGVMEALEMYQILADVSLSTFRVTVNRRRGY